MSSYPRRSHVWPWPPPAQNHPHHHASSPPLQSNVDPNYLAYLRSQAAHLDSQISALSGCHCVSSGTTGTQGYECGPSQHYPRVPPPQRPSRQNHNRDGSKWHYYAVKNGLEGDDVYSLWHQAHPYCWGQSTKYFFPGSFCKGFNSYNRAWDFLLGVQDADPTQTSQETPVPMEPPPIDVPAEPVDLDPFLPSHHYHQDSYVPTKEEDDESLTTYNYVKILKKIFICHNTLTYLIRILHIQTPSLTILKIPNHFCHLHPTKHFLSTLTMLFCRY